MRSVIAAGVLAVGFGLAAAPCRAEPVRVVFSGGHVTVVATDVPAADVFAEWARVGRTEVIGAERLPARSVTLDLVDVGEQEAIEALVGPGFGFVASLKSEPAPATSHFARLVLGAAGSVAEAPTPEPLGPPESRFSYFVPAGAEPTGEFSISPPEGTIPPVPEELFEYYIPARAREAMELPQPEVTAAAPVAPDTPRGEPEARFEYYRPAKTMPPKNADGEPILQPESLSPPPDTPYIEPELRFEYYTPSKAAPPKQNDGPVAGPPASAPAEATAPPNN